MVSLPGRGKTLSIPDREISSARVALLTPTLLYPRRSPGRLPESICLFRWVPLLQRQPPMLRRWQRHISRRKRPRHNQGRREGLCARTRKHAILQLQQEARWFQGRRFCGQSRSSGRFPSLCLTHGPNIHMDDQAFDDGGANGIVDRIIYGIIDADGNTNREYRIGEGPGRTRQLDVQGRCRGGSSPRLLHIGVWRVFVPQQERHGKRCCCCGAASCGSEVTGSSSVLPRVQGLETQDCTRRGCF